MVLVIGPFHDIFLNKGDCFHITERGHGFKNIGVDTLEHLLSLPFLLFAMG